MGAGVMAEWLKPITAVAEDPSTHVVVYNHQSEVQFRGSDAPF